MVASSQDLAQNTEKVGSEQGDGRMGDMRSPELFPFVDDDDGDECSDE